MKTAFYLSAFSFLFSSTSCQKTYTCECTYTEVKFTLHKSETDYVNRPEKHDCKAKNVKVAKENCQKDYAVTENTLTTAQNTVITSTTCKLDEGSGHR